MQKNITIDIDINDNKKIMIKKDKITTFLITIEENNKYVDVSGYDITAVFNVFGDIIEKKCTFKNGLVNLILDEDIVSEFGVIQMEIIFKNDIEKVTTFTIDIEITDKEEI